MTSSMPDLGGDGTGRRARCRRSAAPAAARARVSSATASALVGLTVSATTRRPRAPPSQPTATTVWPAGLAPRLRAASSSGGSAWPSRRAGRPAGDDGVAVDDALDAEALAVAERPRPPAARRARAAAPGDRAGDRVLGGVLERAGEAQQPRSRSTPSATMTSTHAHAPGRDGAGLVEHDRVDAPGRLQHLGALDEDAELGAAAGADEQRRRRGEPERARAGDDQHGDGGGEREGARSHRRRARSRAWRRRGR